MSAVMDQRGGRAATQVGLRLAPSSCSAGSNATFYADFSLRHFYEHVTEKHRVKVSYNWLRLMLQEAGVVEKEPARGRALLHRAREYGLCREPIRISLWPHNAGR
jgi:hypothetical protein